MVDEKKNELSSEEKGKIIKATGFEAVARGAYEASVSVAAGFPGVPTTDILNSLLNISRDNPRYDVDLEWSTNQKVGFEVAISGSMSNARSLAVMKHVGFNVSADAFMTSCCTGALGGLVFLSIDDPSMVTSENEQDNRYYGLHGLVPVFSPSSVQELKDMLKYAFQFSEDNSSVVLFNTTLRLIEEESDLELGDVVSLDRDIRFTEEYRDRWTNLPSNARVNRVKLLERLEKISGLAEDFPFNSFEDNSSKIGVLSSGICYAYTQGALKELGAQEKVSVCKLGMEYPYPRKKLINFMAGLDKLLVIEELEPIFEEYLKSLAFEEDLSLKILGKNVFPEAFAFNQEMIQDTLKSLLEGKTPQKLEPTIPQNESQIINNDKVQLQEIFFKAAKSVEEEKDLKFIYAGDFGCETFHDDTQEIVDTFISQGASIGFANGIAKLDKGTVISFLNNNSFYHSGYYGLINAVYNENAMIMVFVNELAESRSNIENLKESQASKYLKRQPTTKSEFLKMFYGMGVPEDKIYFTEVDEPEIKKAFEKAAETDGVRVIVSI